MKSLFFGWLLSILINTILCISVRDEFIILNEVVLNNEPAELYIASQTCSIRYTCKKYEEVSSWVIFTKAHLTDCYYRDRQYNVEFYPDKMVNLKECINHGRVTLKAGQCYLMSNGKETTYNLKNDKSGVIYYDIDWNYNRTLTEYGWCSFYGQKDIDANWINCIDDNLPLNQINIPGSHDSGTFDVGKLSNDAFLNVVFKGLTIPYIVSTGLSEFAQTQDLDITEQLEKGIRYLDVRLSSDNNSPNDLFLSHGKNLEIIGTVPCIKSDDYTVLTFDDVISDCVNFLRKNSNETIIMHLGEERIVQTTRNLGLDQLIAKSTVLNTNKVPNTENKKYKDFFYTGNSIPKLKDARGKIVIVTRAIPYRYEDDDGVEKDIGIQIGVQSNEKCFNYPADGNKCYPIISGDYRFQDAYKLDAMHKAQLVEDVLAGNINKDNNDKFDIPSNKDVLTLNFMNVSRATAVLRAKMDKAAALINERLMVFLSYKEKKDTSLNKSLHNQWVIFDYPSTDVIRKIYQSNDLKNPNFTINKVYIDELSLSTELDYYISLLILFGYKRGEYNEDIRACLQRKLVIDEQGNRQDLVKTNYKCVNNKLNKWYFKESDQDNFYFIVSSYDGKCLSYSDDKLSVEICKGNNNNEIFSIKNGKICSRLYESKCLDGKYDI